MCTTFLFFSKATLHFWCKQCLCYGILSIFILIFKEQLMKYCKRNKTVTSWKYNAGSEIKKNSWLSFWRALEKLSLITRSRMLILPLENLSFQETLHCTVLIDYVITMKSTTSKSLHHVLCLK